MTTALIKKPATAASTSPQTVPADQLVIVTDPAHALYDERIKLPVNDALVQSILVHGIMQPVIVRRNGTKYEVEDGRQRVRAALEANKQLKGATKIKVPIIVRQDDDVEANGVMIALNELRTADTPLVRARKARRALSLGMGMEDVANAFGISPTAIKNLLTVLDCEKSVQELFETGQVPISAANRISRLPREDQAKAIQDLKNTGGATKARIRAKVSAVAVARKTGKPEVAVPVAGAIPSKTLLKRAMGAYPAEPMGMDQLVNPYLLIQWVLTGEGADMLTPGPDGYGTLAEWVKSLSRGTGRHTKAKS